MILNIAAFCCVFILCITSQPLESVFCRIHQYGRYNTSYPFSYRPTASIPQIYSAAPYKRSEYLQYSKQHLQRAEELLQEQQSILLDISGVLLSRRDTQYNAQRNMTSRELLKTQRGQFPQRESECR